MITSVFYQANRSDSTNKNPEDLPEQLVATLDSGTLLAPPDPCDVCMLIKRYISSEGLSQRPLRVMTPARASRVDLVPTQKLHGLD